MPDTERRTLVGHQRRLSWRLSSGCGVLLTLLSLPFFAGGMLLVLRAAGVLVGGAAAAPAAVLAGVGAGFLVAGGSLAVFACHSSLRQRAERRRRERLLAERPREPWLADHDWDPAVSADDDRNLHRSLFLGAAFLCTFMIPFHWRILTVVLSREGPWFLALLLVPFDAVIGICLYLGAKGWLRRRKYGSAFLRFERFPYFLGETLEACLLVPRLPPDVKAVRMTLRWIEERMAHVDRKRAGHGGSGPNVLCDQLYADVRELPVPRWDPWGGAAITVSFPIPAVDLPTRLEDELPRYWEIEAKAEAAGVDFEARFLAPVYTRPGT